MSYYVAIDSCGELTSEMKESGCFGNVPLTINVDGYEIIDDETFDQADFLRRAAATENAPRSACPSPEKYREAFDRDVDHIFAVTLSAELSGSYNSAMLGRDLILEDHPERQIYVFNSRSASIGETLIGLKIRECEEKHMSFHQIIDTVEKYIDSQTTWFVLESLEALRKNGRLSNLKAKVASLLNIKPVMMSTPSGNITQLTQCRGINKALVTMVDNIAATVKDPGNRILAISHCNCRERGMMVRDALLERLPLKDVILLDTRGISSLYASDGGIIVVV
ncbi:MAG: DegV family protein [Lachnospiraceae bacterium]|nr:DegV family protein [Lachnospiraceae bacterium]